LPRPWAPRWRGCRTDPSLLQQDGWTIAVQERFADGLPRRLQITRPALAGTAPDQPPQPALNLRLVLDEPGGAAQ